MAKEYSWLSNSRCLVTGGAGFIGSNVTKKLLELGGQVTVLDDFSTGDLNNLKGLDAKVVEGTITDEKLLPELVSQSDYVFHFAAVSSVPRSLKNPMGTAWANVWGTQILLEGARNSAVKRVVLSTSAACYGGIDSQSPLKESLAPEPLSPYAAHKVAGECLAKTYSTSFGVPCVSLRYFNVFGPGQHPQSDYAAVIPKFIELAKKGETLTVFGDGKQTRDFIHVDNVVHANLLATAPDISVGGEVINIGSGESISLLKLVEVLEKVMGKKLEVSFKPSQPGDVYFSQADISKAKNLLHYSPAIPLEEGLARLLNS